MILYISVDYDGGAQRSGYEIMIIILDILMMLMTMMIVKFLMINNMIVKGLHADYVWWFLPDSYFTIAWFWLHSGRHCNDDDVNSADVDDNDVDDDDDDDDDNDDDDDFDDDAVDDDDNDGRNNGKPSTKIL